MKLKVLYIFGTRPEAIKLAPLISCMRKKPEFSVVLCSTGQHKEMLNQVLTLFELKPDYDLALMKSNQSLPTLSANMLVSISPVLSSEKPDIVIVHGDTTTAMVAGMCSFYQKIPVAHLEAGLRSHDIMKPWPEELNRKIIANLAFIHFSPTALARDNLIKEGIRKEKIYVTGNTVVDALLKTKEKISNNKELANSVAAKFYFLKKNIPLVLLTGHRRESLGGKQVEIFEAIKTLALEHKIQVIYPVHLHPRVKNTAKKVLGGLNNVFLINPIDYVEMVYLLKSCHFVITDSGGIQEEAPSLGKPVLVTREVTERIEGVKAQSAKLVGANKRIIIQEASKLILDKEYYQSISQVSNPYGDGLASKRICQILQKINVNNKDEMFNA